MKKIIILCCILLMAGCGRWVAVDKFPDTITKKFYEKNYKIGEMKTVFIGQEIIKVRPYSISYSSVKNVSSRDPLDIEVPFKFTNYKIKIEALKDYPIKEYVKIGGQRYDILELPDSHDNTWGILIKDNGEIFQSGIYSPYDKMIFYPESISITPANSKLNISFRKIPGPASKDDKIQDGPGLNYELIYSGKNDVSLNATYREYTTEDLARTAFYQNVIYRPDARDIRFKNFVIQIHDSSNEKITYTVHEDGVN